MRLETLIERARQGGHPVLEGERATFVWLGQEPVALLDDIHHWEDSPRPLRQAAPGVWTISQRLPPDAYLEYSFYDPRRGTRLADPLNPRRTWNGINAYNHYFYMPQGGPTGLARPAPPPARGRVRQHWLGTNELAAGARRSVWLYQPAAAGPVPLLVVLDGRDYLRRARLDVLADNLIASRRVRPFAMAFVQNGGQARSVEYSCSEATLGLLTEGVLPLARRELRLAPPGKKPYGILGASMGGLMAVHAGLRLPDLFGRVLSQSGAFRIPGYDFVVMDLVRCQTPTGVDFWLDCGRFDFLLEANRAMAALMKARGYRITYREYPGGHNYTAWRDDLGRGLESLFGA